MRSASDGSALIGPRNWYRIVIPMLFLVDLSILTISNMDNELFCVININKETEKNKLLSQFLIVWVNNFCV